MFQQSSSPPLIPTSNNYDITEFNGFSRNDDDYDLANTYPTAHLPNMGLDYNPSNLVHIDDVEQFINVNTNTLVNLKGKPIHHDYYHNNSSNVSTICDTFIDQETQQIIIKTIPGFGLCDEFYHKLHLPEVNLNDTRDIIDTFLLEYSPPTKQPFGPRVFVSIYNPSNNTVTPAIVVNHDLYIPFYYDYPYYNKNKYHLKIIYPQHLQDIMNMYPHIDEANMRRQYINSPGSGETQIVHEEYVWPRYHTDPYINQQMTLQRIRTYNNNPHVLNNVEKNNWNGFNLDNWPEYYIQRTLPSSIYNVLPEVYDQQYINDLDNGGDLIQISRQIQTQESDNYRPQFQGNTNYYDYTYSTISDLQAANSYFFKTYPNLQNIQNTNIGGRRKKSLCNRKKYHSRKKYRFPKNKCKSNKNKR